jgi:hypothetical protein
MIKIMKNNEKIKNRLLLESFCLALDILTLDKTFAGQLVEKFNEFKSDGLDDYESLNLTVQWIAIQHLVQPLADIAIRNTLDSWVFDAYHDIEV